MEEKHIGPPVIHRIAHLPRIHGMNVSKDVLKRFNSTIELLMHMFDRPRTLLHQGAMASWDSRNTIQKQLAIYSSKEARP